MIDIGCHTGCFSRVQLQARLGCSTAKETPFPTESISWVLAKGTERSQEMTWNTRVNPQSLAPRNRPVNGPASDGKRGHKTYLRASFYSKREASNTEGHISGWARYFGTFPTANSSENLGSLNVGLPGPGLSPCLRKLCVLLSFLVSCYMKLSAEAQRDTA